MKNYLKSNSIAFLITFAVLLYGLSVAGSLPEMVASHWDKMGNVDRYSGKSGILFLVPVLAFIAINFLYALIRLAPPKYNLPNSQSIVGSVTASVAILISSFQIGLIRMVMTASSQSFILWVQLGFALTLLIAGNIMSKTERNFAIGYPTSWALASEKNWKATHRFSGRFSVLLGILLLALSYFESSRWIILGGLAIATLTPVVYSYCFYRQCDSQES